MFWDGAAVASVVAVGISIVVVIVSVVWSRGHQRRAQSRGIVTQSSRIGASLTVCIGAAVVTAVLGGAVVAADAANPLAALMIVTATIATAAGWTARARASAAVALITAMGSGVPPR